ncbi:GntR family transcriptional regulator [Alicyclobacillus dauci]|uniref:GntR family transcriptional regulator n=1 Tax=Alicyclobacillus dauci TaxID=1475485 RepID=A0ABY6Z331_9BACL|nr:GntR family transcriptional regulator [Alicyclobacillus dauci]WAH37164.1 GntR family transcriptional regulator [Alicyclobacillus dauci]
MEIRKPEPVYQQVYDILFQQIIEGQLASGVKLSEERIAADLHVSRTPVREAIIRLEHEGLLRNKTVIELTPKEIKESYEIRILLEGHAAKQAALTMTPEDKEFLKSVIDRARSGDFEAKMKANTLFHNAIVRACQNDQLSQFIERMQTIILLCRKDIVKSRTELPHEHEEIYDAVIRGDGDAAERLMKSHLQRNLNNFLNSLPAENRISLI